jgi:hypothetical protein
MFAYSNCEVNMTIRHDTEEMASTARGIGAQVIQGPLRYPGRNGGLEIGGVAIERPLCELQDQEVLLIVAPLRPALKAPITCGLCGTPHERDECPACKAKREEAKRADEERLLFDEEFSPLLSEG